MEEQHFGDGPATHTNEFKAQQIGSGEGEAESGTSEGGSHVNELIQSPSSATSSQHNDQTESHQHNNDEQQQSGSSNIGAGNNATDSLDLITSPHDPALVDQDGNPIPPKKKLVGAKGFGALVDPSAAVLKKTSGPVAKPAIAVASPAISVSLKKIETIPGSKPKAQEEEQPEFAKVRLKRTRTEENAMASNTVSSSVSSSAIPSQTPPLQSEMSRAASQGTATTDTTPAQARQAGDSGQREKSNTATDVTDTAAKGAKAQRKEKKKGKCTVQ